MGNRATNKKIIVLSNSMGGELINAVKNDGDVLVWNETAEMYVHHASNDHDHEIGNQVLLFENQLV